MSSQSSLVSQITDHQTPREAGNSPWLNQITGFGEIIPVGDSTFQQKF